jgi:glycosyltransferase involved in cell wall biosynthesis
LIRLAFCTDGIFPQAVGGIQRHSKLLVEELATYSDVEIEVFHPHQELLFEGLENVTEIQIENINASKNYLLECRKYSKRIHAKLITLEYDVIYSQGLSVWYKATDFASRLVVNPHGLEPYQALSRRDKLIAIPFKLVFSRLFKTALKVVSLGGGLTGILEKIVPKENIVVLPNATAVTDAIERTYGEAKTPLTCMFVARFTANKGIHILIKAIEELNAEGYQDKFRFEIAGKGPLYNFYKEKFSLPNIHYWGFISDDDLNQLYRNADVFVFPTLFEGMPTVVLEAMTRSQIIIVSDVGATAELVDESNGYLIKKNNVNALKDALLTTLNLSAAEKSSKSSMSYTKAVMRFSWPIVAEGHYELFKSISGK